jgi:hypothetical protein
LGCRQVTQIIKLLGQRIPVQISRLCSFAEFVLNRLAARYLSPVTLVQRESKIGKLVEFCGFARIRSVVTMCTVRINVKECSTLPKISACEVRFVLKVNSDYFRELIFVMKIWSVFMKIKLFLKSHFLITMMKTTANLTTNKNFVNINSDRFCFVIPGIGKIFQFAIASKPVMGPTQLPIQWVSGLFPRRGGG